MLEDEVDEKYYLSDKMIKYISATGTANFKNPDSRINLDVARPITTDQNKRAGTTNYLSGDLPSNFDLSIPIKNNTKKGYLEAQAGDGVYTNTSTKRGTVQKESIQTLTTQNNLGVCVIGGIGEKKSNGGTQWYQQDRVYDNNVGLSLSTTAQPYYPDNQFRIRKLTPCECWRLMGFDDEDFEKAEKVNSNTQLYKQAGNSIVVNVLEEILKVLLC